MDILYSKQYYSQKTHLSTKEIYQNIDQVAIMEKNEQYPTTLKTIKVDKSTRYLNSWIPFFDYISIQYEKYNKIIDYWSNYTTRQHINPTKGKYAIH